MLTAAADPGQQLILVYFSAGLISAALLIAPVALAALGFSLPLMLGALVALRVEGVNPLLWAVVLAYEMMVMSGVALYNRNFMERVAGQLQVEEQKELIAMLLREFEENASDWLWGTDARHCLTHVSERMVKVTQLPEQALRGRPLGHWGTEEGCRQLDQCLAKRAPFRDIRLPVRISGAERWWSLTGKPVFDGGGAFVGYRGVGSDVTAAKQSEEQIAYLARHDSLTELPNRVLFQDGLRHACARSERDEGGFALLCLDLDEFKAVNDTLGHATGDALLVAVGKRLLGCVRDGDVVARLGGDEFAIIVTDADAARAASLARRIVERVSEPFHIEGMTLGIGVSIGIAMAPGDGTNPQALMRCADLALYRAKADGRSTWCFFEADMDARAQAKRAMQADLRLALLRDELMLYYQPIIDLTTLKVAGVEALLRWQCPGRGIVSPADFIPIAEESGLIVLIGEWAIRRACQDAARWPDGVRVAVNLSPVQFRTSALVEVVKAALAQSGLAPDRLELEITESIFLEATAATLASLHELRALGVRVALDDFGTGYSSLSYLRSFPFDKIKIDRSFIRDLVENRDSNAITQAITGLAANLGMVTTAEGVETQDQVRVLRERGCTQVQGYLFARPEPPEHMTQVLATYGVHGAAPALTSEVA